MTHRPRASGGGCFFFPPKVSEATWLSSKFLGVEQRTSGFEGQLSLPGEIEPSEPPEDLCPFPLAVQPPSASHLLSLSCFLSLYLSISLPISYLDRNRPTTVA